MSLRPSAKANPPPSPSTMDICGQFAPGKGITKGQTRLVKFVVGILQFPQPLSFQEIKHVLTCPFLSRIQRLLHGHQRGSVTAWVHEPPTEHLGLRPSSVCFPASLQPLPLHIQTLRSTFCSSGRGPGAASSSWSPLHRTQDPDRAPGTRRRRRFPPAPLGGAAPTRMGMDRPVCAAGESSSTPPTRAAGIRVLKPQVPTRPILAQALLKAPGSPWDSGQAP